MAKSSAAQQSQSVPLEALRWEDLPIERVNELQTRQVIHTSHATIVRLVSQKGCTVPLHNHVHEQVTILISGAFRFEALGQTVLLQPGGIFRVASDVPHKADVLEDSVTIEVFTPSRDDWKS